MFSTSRSFAGYSLDTDHSEFNGPTLESNAWDIDSVEIVILFPLQILASVFVSAMKRKIDGAEAGRAQQADVLRRPSIR